MIRWVGGDDKGKEWDVFREDPDAHVDIDQIKLGKEYWSEGRVYIHYIGEQVLERPPELDGIWRVPAAHSTVNTTEGVVVDESCLPELLGNNTNRTHKEVGYMGDKVQR